jgi:predicted transglutaminase-like cysteine proteinase
MFSPRVTAALVVALNFASGNASAGSSQFYLGDNVLAPVAHTIFCTKYPRDCSRSGASLTYFTVDPVDLYRQLDAVNREVNAAIEPAPANADKSRGWELFPSQGDCNDYVVSKRHELLKRGWPSSALQLAEIIIPETGEHHLVLVANARGNSFILDNLKFTPVPLAESFDYHWVRIESSLDPGFWISMAQNELRDAVVQPVAANSNFLTAKTNRSGDHHSGMVR